MNPETKQCQNCKHDFTIEPEDFSFYEKMKVPPPTWCPECRVIRRFTWRNESFLYKRTDDRTGEILFSAYPPKSPIKTVAQEFWMSDAWDPMQYARSYDFNEPFFDQMRDFMKTVPWPSRWVVNATNSDYSINTNDMKDCYLVMSSSYVQNSLYSVWIQNTDDSMDLYNVAKSSLCYDSTLLHGCSRVFFSKRCEDSHDLYFSRDCVGCHDCFGCVNLKSKSYCIFNEQYTKEEYKEKVAEFGINAYTQLEQMKTRVSDFGLNFPVRFVSGRQNVNTTGDYIYHSKNVHDSYNVQGGEDLKFTQNILVGSAKDSYDYSNWGENAEQMYESILCGLNISNCRFSIWCWSNDIDLQYCMGCRNSSHLFGCMGLNNKQYCIFNKQYTKEEYEVLVPKIIQHMDDMPYRDKMGIIYTYGEFFPLDMSHTPYNESIAQEYSPLQAKEAKKLGYFWYEDSDRIHEVTIQTGDLPDRIVDVKDSILQHVIGCAHNGECRDRCSKAFKLTKREIEFYRRFDLPLPRLCFNCRHANRLQQRNPMRMWHRTCQCAGTHSQPTTTNPQQPDYQYQNTATHAHGTTPCPTEFETSYAPDRPEIVYCEQCYNAEVA